MGYSLDLRKKAVILNSAIKVYKFKSGKTLNEKIFLMNEN